MSVYNFFSVCSEVSRGNKVEANLPPSLRHLSWPANLKWRLVRSCSHVIPSHPIPSAIAKYRPYEPYTTYSDRPLQSTVLHDCTNPTTSVKILVSSTLLIQPFVRANLSLGNSSTSICREPLFLSIYCKFDSVKKGLKGSAVCLYLGCCLVSEIFDFVMLCFNKGCDCIIIILQSLICGRQTTIYKNWSVL